ncbi:MAG: class I SAM-dependent methyltransferase [Opitutaceae bacterium]|nr:class I SAM-dependent methyltransferase [Opitutaceae bacterium]
MSVFDRYARYYDLLYRDKDYAGEARFVHDQIVRQGGTVGTLLELGCGTGRHAIELGRLGYRVTGVDLSPGMVALAEARASVLPENEWRSLRFQVGDVRSVRVEEKYDTVVSLFHVMSYQTSDEDLRAAFRTAVHHLKPGGIFMFDFWHGLGVLRDLPTVRIRRLEDDDLHVTRLAEPDHRAECHQVIVNYDLFLKDKRTNTISEIREAHPLRYLFLPELHDLFRWAGLELLASGAWNSVESLTEGHWYGWVVGRLSGPHDRQLGGATRRHQDVKD